MRRKRRQLLARLMDWAQREYLDAVDAGVGVAQAALVADRIEAFVREQLHTHTQGPNPHNSPPHPNPTRPRV